MILREEKGKKEKKTKRRERESEKKTNNIERKLQAYIHIVDTFVH